MSGTLLSSPVADHPVDDPDSGPGPGWQLRYWSIFIGEALSLVGSALTQFVLLWWITDTTGSVAALTTAGMAALLPQALLGPIGGVVADRYSRRFLMIAADLVSALSMAVLILLFLTHRVELWHIYTMLFVRSAMQAFQQPAAAASTAILVPESFLSRAAGLGQTLAGIMLIAAAPLGALAMATMPLAHALAIDVVTAVFGIVPLLVFAIPQMRPAAGEGARTSLWADLREGIDLVWRNPGLKRLYALMAFVTLIVMPAFTLVPLLVKAHFLGGAPEVALMEGLAGGGMVLGGLIAVAITMRRRIVWVLAGFALGCFTLGLVGLTPGDMIWLAVFWWALSTIFYVLGNAPLLALLQTTVPNHQQGRVLSLLTTVAALAAPVGLALATPLGELVGIRWLFVLMGTAGGLVALLGFLSPALRGIERR